MACRSWEQANILQPCGEPWEVGTLTTISRLWLYFYFHMFRFLHLIRSCRIPIRQQILIQTIHYLHIVLVNLEPIDFFHSKLSSPPSRSSVAAHARVVTTSVSSTVPVCTHTSYTTPRLQDASSSYPSPVSRMLPR